MTITTTSSLPAPVQQYFDRVLLSRPTPNLIHKKFAVRKQMPDKSGRIMRFRRYTNLATATVPLGNSGINPPAQTLSAANIDATINWYGTYVIINEQVTLQNQDPVLRETASLLAQSLRESEDELLRDMLESTASFINCSQGVNGDMPTELTGLDISDAQFALLDNNAKMISDNIEGEDKFSTAPVREAFWCMMNTNILGDLEAVDGFISEAQYPSSMTTLSSEWGSVKNVRFTYSTLGSVTQNASALGADVYNCFITGQEAYACVEQDGASAEFIYKPRGYGNDYLNQNQSAGYKFAEAQRILNDSWIINLRATRSS